MAKKKEGFSVDDLLGSLFPSEKLSDLFDQRLVELNLKPTNALEVLDIEYRALQGILNSTSKRVDMTNFLKLATFLKIPREKVIALYFNELEKNYPDVIGYPVNKADFITQHFDLATLKKAGFIQSLTDFKHIEQRINQHFGFKSIFEYKLPSKEVAFSAGVREPKNIHTRLFWINAAIDAFEEFANPYPYNQKGLMAYFPEIRWHSTDVERGLTSVISDLYKLGITVIYQSTLPSLHLRGATMEVNEKPCIVITDYRGFYTTLWHALCHELSHVLFDFNEIREHLYHLSEDDEADLSVTYKEKEADDFASAYLFAKDKLQKAKPHIANRKFITTMATEYQVHPSFIYTYYAYAYGKQDDKAWARAKQYNPPFEGLVSKMENRWDAAKPIKEHVQELKKSSIYQ